MNIKKKKKNTLWAVKNTSKIHVSYDSIYRDKVDEWLPVKGVF